MNGSSKLTVAAWAVVTLAALGCVSTTPRFSPDIQRAINREDMRRMETDELVLYYPEGARADVLAVAARLEYCRREVQRLALVKGGLAADKSTFVLPRLPLNNAYVQPRLGGIEQVAVLPTYNTVNLFIAYGIPPDPGNIGCHEMVHDQSLRQISGLAAILNRVFGDAYSPQLGLDPWWQEGLAVYYETKLQGTGRLWTRYFDGLFAAGMQEVSTLNGGYLSFQQRGVAAGAQYLIGAHFVDYLARAHGERRLWQVIAEQSNAWGFPFAISNEFRRVYDRSLSALIEEFEADTRRRYVRRGRPPAQRSLLRVGNVAGFARAPDGLEVIVSEGVDDPPRIIVRRADGTTLSSHRLTDIGIGRRLLAPRVSTISGLSLTADGAHAYFVALDSGPIFSESRLMHLDVLADTLEVAQEDIGGAGGSISPDGAYYYFSRPLGRGFTLGSALFRLEIASGQIVQLTTPAARHYQADPVVSPDGQRLLVTEASDSGIRLGIYPASGGARLSEVAAPEGVAFEGSWLGDDRVIFAGSDPERMQIFETDLQRQTYRRLTDAPHLAVSGFSNGQTLRFLNRDGWSWTLDEVPHPPVAVAVTGASAATTPAAARPRRTTFAEARHRAIDDRAAHVVSDEPYSGFDGLFRPSAWGPWLSQREEGNIAVGLGVTGGDRLGWQRWALGGAWDIKARQPSGALSYLNTMLAPVLVQLNLAHVGRREELLDDFPFTLDEPVTIRETIGSLRLSASWFDSYEVALGGRYDAARYELAATSDRLAELRFAGPFARLGFRSAETTPYTNERLALGADTMATYFPDAFSSVDYDLVDVLARTELVLPLPISRRHTLTVAGRYRALLGAPPGQNLLQLGGSGTDVLPLASDGSPTDDGGAGLLPPGLRFSERLRGFEDQALFARRALIGDATYTYPFIIDWGSASTLRVLPALFVKQLNLDLFFAAASLLEAGPELAMAAGASLELEWSLWLVPVSFELQGARRLSYDEDYAVYFLIGSNVD